MAILSSLESSTLDETLRCASEWFMLTLKKTQNLELVNLKCIIYAQPILPLRNGPLLIMKSKIVFFFFVFVFVFVFVCFFVFFFFVFVFFF